MIRIALVLLFSILFIPGIHAQDGERGYDDDLIERLNADSDYDYNREKVQPVEEDQSVISRLLDGLADLIAAIMDSGIGYIIMIGLVAWLIFAIVRNSSRMRRIRIQKELEGDDGLQILSSEKLETVDFEALIRDALRKGNYRLAIRYAYLKVLQQLQFAQLIDWQKQKTNYDYLMEVPSAQKDPFRKVLVIYEYVWYGEFMASQSLYDRSRKEIDRIIQSLPGR